MQTRASYYSGDWKARSSAGVAQPDARFDHVLNLIRTDKFGWADFFEPLVNSISASGDFYLLANDFASYLEAQVCPLQRHRACAKLVGGVMCTCSNLCLLVCGTYMLPVLASACLREPGDVQSTLIRVGRHAKGF